MSVNSYTSKNGLKYVMTKTEKILSRLITIPSFVDENHNEEQLGVFVENFLKTKTNLTVERQAVEKGRFNLIARGKSDPKIILFGHLDTVLPKNETEKPFSPRIIDDRLFGLGSVDMKAGLAIMLDIASKDLSEEIGFVFSVDEEYDFKGAKKLMEIKDLHPKTVINVEPTNQKILNGCRGITEFSFDLIGKSAHAGKKQLGINAIECAVSLSNFLQQKMSEFDDEDAKSSVNLAYLHGGILDKMLDGEPVVNKMGNVVPDFARVILEIRIGKPEITQTLITDLVNQKSKEMGTRLENLKFKFYLGSMLTKKNDLKSFEESVSKSGKPIEYADINSTGYFELQMLQEKWGGNCLAYGPGPEGLSHAANEYVDLPSIQSVQKVIEDFIKQENTR